MHVRILVLPVLLATPALAPAQYVESSVNRLLDVSMGTAGDLFAWTVVELGDVNADGVSDFAASAPFDDAGVFISSTGTIHAFSGASGAVLWRRSESLVSSILGYSLETMDWNGDGVLDVVAAAPFNSTGGRVFVYAGQNGSMLATLDVSAPNDGFGCSLATGGDFDGDGSEDLAVGALGVDTAAGSEVGRVYVFRRGTGAQITSIDGPGANAEFGLGLAFLGDISSPPDGRDELVVGNRLASSFFDGEARVISFAGGTASQLYSVSGVGMGFDIIGDRIDAGLDADGDGSPDFLVGDLSADEVDVFSGRTGAPLYTLDGDQDPSSGFGSAHFIHDADHDGRADIAVGAWPSDSGASDSGKVFVYSGASGTLLKTITPTGVDVGLGCDVRGMSDFDGDGRRDLLVGAYGNGGVGRPLGRVLVFSGHVPAPANRTFPSERAGDPVLADAGGDPFAGPLIASEFERFNLALDCAGFAAGGIWAIEGYAQRHPAALPSPFGSLWVTGPRLFHFLGRHAGGAVECIPGGRVLPSDMGLIGLEYTVQGLCGGGGRVRFSGAITQTIGN